MPSTGNLQSRLWPRRLGVLALIVTLAFLYGGTQCPAPAHPGAPGAPASPPIILTPVGYVENLGGKTVVRVAPAYAEALAGLEDFSHLWVIYWFHDNDTPEKRRTLQVHPRNNPANPLTGVFATRSPLRPNLLALTACRLVRRDGLTLEVEGLDARPGSPVLDLKPYLPQLDAPAGPTIPPWAQGPPPR